MWLLALSIAFLSPDAARVQVPTGFSVERAAEGSDSFLSIAFDAAGRLFAGIANGPIRRFVDADGDGKFEKGETFSSGVTDARGLAWQGDVLYAVGMRDGHAGLFRISADSEHAKAGEPELLCAIEGAGDHGAHGVAIGPDGDAYVSIGDGARLSTPPDPRAPRSTGYEGALSPIIDDANGLSATGGSWPYGVIARVDAKTKVATYHSVGYRNPCDLAFDDEGELYTCDVDSPQDLGLPWYRPARVLHAIPLADFGARRGSGSWAPEFEDTLPGVCTLGRGAPAGVCFGRYAHFPERYARALYVADPALGRIVAVHLKAMGASASGEMETFASGEGVGHVTDVAIAPNGDLYFAGDGLQRIVYAGDAGAATALSSTSGVLTRANVRDDPPDKVVTALRSSIARAQRRACEELVLTGADLSAHVDRFLELVVSADRFVRFAAREALVRLPQGEQTRLARRMLGDLESTQAPDFRQICQALLVLSRTKPVGMEKDMVTRVPYAHPDPKRWSDALMLRALEVGVLEVGSLDPKLLNAQQFSLQRGLPDPDPIVARMQAQLLGHWAAIGSVDKLVAAISIEKNMTVRIAMLDALHAAPNFWTPEKAARAFSAAEAALSATGAGASYAGYIDAMRDAVRTRLEPRELSSLAVGASRASDPGVRVGSRTLAWIASKLDAENAKPVVAELRKLYDASSKDAAGFDERCAVLSALGGAASPDARAWLREIATSTAPERPFALRALAVVPLDEDFAAFVDGLDEIAYGATDACARALVALEHAPSDTAVLNEVLDVAQRLGNPRGLNALNVVRHWIGQPPATSADDWKQTFQPRSRANDEWEGPRYSQEHVLAFLRASSARAGSPARGANVFMRAACASCHTLGGAITTVPLRKGEVGPDLAGRAQGLDDAMLLAAMGHRAPLIPAGAIDALSLEEIKDLIAFLRADGKGATPESDWTRAFEPASRSSWTGDAKFWKLDHDMAVGRTAEKSGASRLVSSAKRGDLELAFDVRVSTEGRVTFHYRSKIESSKPEPIGYQFDVSTRARGDITARDARAALTRVDGMKWRLGIKADEWIHVWMKLQGDQHVIEIDGTTLADVHDKTFAEGALAFELDGAFATDARFARLLVRNVP